MRAGGGYTPEGNIMTWSSNIKKLCSVTPTSSFLPKGVVDGEYCNHHTTADRSSLAIGWRVETASASVFGRIQDFVRDMPAGDLVCKFG